MLVSSNYGRQILNLMNTLTSTQKGDAFEDKVFGILEHMLQTDQFFVAGRRCKIYKKKSYHSRLRGSDIIFDIAIESYMPGSAQYSLLILIECKDYTSAVPVNDIEEFESKVRQVGEHNTKAIMIANSTFAKGCFNIARSTGIALARVNEQKELTWFNSRKDNTQYIGKFTEIEGQLQSFTDIAKGFFSFVGDDGFESLPEALLALGIIDKYERKDLTIPYLAEDEMNAIVERIVPPYCYPSGRLDIDRFCEHLSILYDVDFDLNAVPGDDHQGKTLGKIVYDPLKIFISRDLAGDENRRRFTVAHEAGHLVLHSALLMQYFRYHSDSEASIFFHGNVTSQMETRLEIQANMFAAKVLLPLPPLLETVKRFFRDQRIYKNFLVLDEQPQNKITVFSLLKIIEDRFMVSKEMAKTRLKNLQLLKDKTDYSIKSILKNKRPFS